MSSKDDSGLKRHALGGGVSAYSIILADEPMALEKVLQMFKAELIPVASWRRSR